MIMYLLKIQKKWPYNLVPKLEYVIKKENIGPTTDTKFVQAELAKFLTDNYGVGSFD